MENKDLTVGGGEVVKEEQTLWNILSCPVCYEIPFGEIYQCEKGHHLCRKCKLRIQDLCPVCRSQLGKMSRNLIAERLIADSTFSCPNECNMKQMIKGDDMVAHLDNTCKFRELNCPYCPDKAVRVNGFIEHLIGVHGAVGSMYPILLHCHRQISIKVRPETIIVSEQLHVPNYVFYDRKYFLLNLKSERAQFDMLFISVTMIGSELEAEKYIAKISMKAANGAKILWELPVTRFRPSFESSRRCTLDKDFATLTWDQLKSYSKITKVLTNGPIKKVAFEFQIDFEISKANIQEDVNQDDDEDLCSRTLPMI